ncbi:hypothetical protein V494_07279 [Pseudogymnoascus sp. VKM F-4513 (FW-928)]|nr:hypothetical protein V494_07279 [Pseudogymnoascus sp. VKM F-4513 (FW-928)]
MHSTLRSPNRLCQPLGSQIARAGNGRRGMQSASTESRKEGDISSVFSSLSGEVQKPLPQRFAEQKQRLINGNEDAVRHAWNSLLPQLRQEIEEIKSTGPAIVPELDFKDIGHPNTQQDFAKRLKKTGVAVIRDVVSEEEALGWKSEIREYIKQNPQTKAFPPDDPQVYELYWSRPQLRARAHPNLLAAQSFLMSHWRSSSPTAPVSPTHPVSYADRLRIRNPGDNRFALGPHCDGGSVERWEDNGYGLGGVYDAVFRGDLAAFDPWESSSRLEAVSDNYNGAGACSMFRMFQGWMSMSNTAPGEGTLRVNPLFDRATAYYLLRPFFEAVRGPDGMGKEDFLSANNWRLKKEQDSTLEGAYPSQCLELNDTLHPHLELEKSMINIPAVRPGDYVAWHCDTIHSVDTSHTGTTDSSVLYIPATPLTPANAAYLARQRANFLKGIPPPDFPGGVGEEHHVGRGSDADLANESTEARRSVGAEKWNVEGEEGVRKALEEGNKALGF